MSSLARLAFLMLIPVYMVSSCASNGSDDGASPADIGVEDVPPSSALSSTPPSTAAPTTVMSTTTTTTTTIPPALDIDPTGEDFERIYRELEGAYEYLRQNPEAADPSQWLEDGAGAQTLKFMAERGYRLEPPADGNISSIDRVHVQSRVSDDYVQLWVENTSLQAGRRVLDQDGVAVHVGIDQLEAESNHIVEMRRVDGSWRISQRDWVPTIEHPVSGSEWYVPEVLQPATEATRFTEGSATTDQEGVIEWEGHSYVVPDTGEHCVELRLRDQGRNVHCVSASEARRLTDGANWAVAEFRNATLQAFIALHANLDLGYTIRYGLDDVKHPVSARSGDLRVLGSLSSDFVEEVTVSFRGQTLIHEFPFGGMYCNQWSRNGDPSTTVLADYTEHGRLNSGPVGLRKDTVEDLETYVLGEMYRLHALPRLSIGRERPDDLSPYLEAAGSDANWFVVTLTDWDWNAGDRTRTWAMTFAEDADGWYVDRFGTHQTCPTG